MDFCLANLKRLLFLAGAVSVVLSAQAQSVMQPGQSIIFSSPDNDDAATNAPTISAPAPVVSGLPDAIRPPLFNFGAPPPPANANLPAPQVMAATPGDFERMQKLLDERRNWALLTPAEVLDIPTPEKILGIPERDASGQKKNMTVTERYYERQNQPQAGRTNNYQDDLASRWNLQDDQNDDRLNAARLKPPSGGFENPEQNADAPFNGGDANNSTAAGQKTDGGPGSFFAAPTTQTPTAKMEQQAEMERFRQLLDPPPQPVAAAKSSSGGSVFSSPQSTPDSFFSRTPANPNPVGGSLTPLGSGIGGVPVLPGDASQNSTPPITVTPSWAPQPPPWLSPVPQPGQIPQRKF